MAVLVVKNNSDTGTDSLRDCISRAASGDTIVFAEYADDGITPIFPANTETTITLNPDSPTVSVGNKNLIIDALHDENGDEINGATWTDGGVLKTRVVLDAQQSGRCCSLSSGHYTATISGITFINGLLSGSSYGGALQSLKTGPNYFNSCVFKNSRAARGGGVQAQGGTNIFTNCYFVSCSATDNGGGLYAAASNNNTLNNCVFLTCEAKLGGGSYFSGTSNIFFNACTFNDCAASSSGNGVYIYSTAQITINNCVFIPPTNNTISMIYNEGTNTNGSLVVKGYNVADRIACAASSTVAFDGVDSILAVTTTFSGASATYAATSDSTGYLALPDGTTPPTVGTGVKTCTYGADIESASVSATVVSWTAETLSTPILIEQLSGDSWNTLTDSATGGTYSGTFGEGVTVRLFDGVNFYYASRPAPYWLVNSFAVNASNGWIVDASAVATNGGGGTDPVTGDPLPYWTITTDDITPNF